MKLMSLETKAFRALPDSAWSFTEPSGAVRPVSVVTGAVGAGLTSFLEAVALVASRLGGFGGLPDVAETVRADASGAALKTSWELNDEEMRTGGISDAVSHALVVVRRVGLGSVEADPALLAAHARYDHRPTSSKVMYFPAMRVSNVGFTPMKDFESDQKHAHLLSSADKFAGLPRALMALGRSGRAGTEALERVQQVYGSLVSTSRLAGVAATGLPEFQTTGKIPLAFRQLSFSERNAFVFAACLGLMGLDKSIVLVDSPELGLAPGEAARWLDVMRGAAPDAQWIVATRDAGLVSKEALRLERRPS